MAELLRIHPRDNVAVLLSDASAGEDLSGIITKESIAKGHKMALCDIAVGENVIKYGFPIGRATQPIHVGEHVHTHNMVTNLSGVDTYDYHPERRPLPPQKPDTLMAYERENGKIGIRNELWIIPTVGCINDLATRLAQKANSAFCDCCDGVYAFTHPFGCSQLGDDQTMTQKILAGLVCHPNSAGVLVLGLGCENNSIESLRSVLGETDDSRVKFLSVQETDDEESAALELLRELAVRAKECVRTRVSMSRLIIGLKCGGSDGLSGITANPLLGRLSDKIIAMGGTAILTEVPEMFGAEHLLMNRCPTEELFHQTVTLINEFKTYYTKHHQPVGENPSPGNKAGGITTLEEKSLGCVQKGGTAPVADVLPYGGAAVVPGLNLLSAPGNDLVAATALVAAGAHMVLFTTGRGTPFGTAVPTLKLSTNTELYQKKPHWIDFDAGRLIGEETTGKMLEQLYNLVKQTAEGVPLKNEIHGFRSIALWKNGVTL